MTKEELDAVLEELITAAYDSQRLETLALEAHTSDSYTHAARLMNAAGQRVADSGLKLVAEFERLKKMAGEA